MTSGNDGVPKFENDFQGFLNFLRDKNGINFSPGRFSAILKDDINALAWQKHGLSEQVAEPIFSQMQPYLRSVVQVIRAAFDLTKDVENAIFWYLNTPLHTFEYRTPAQVVSAGNADVLIRYLLIELNRTNGDVTE